MKSLITRSISSGIPKIFYRPSKTKNLWLYSPFPSHNLWKMVKRANISKLYDPNLHCKPGIPATNLSWPQRYRYSRTIFFPFESPRNRYANSYPLDRGLSAESYKLARINLSPYFHSLSPPLSSPLFPSHSAGFLLRYPIIGYLERRSGSTGQPISNSCCRRYLKGKVKKILVNRENMISF